MICHLPRTNQLDFGNDQVKGQGQGHKTSKTYFCHNALNFRLIHRKPMPKCSFFNSLSPDIPHEIVLSSFIGLYVFMYVCYQFFSKTTGPNCMRFSGMICHHPKTNQLDFGGDQVKGQGPGHEKVKNVFLS